MAFAAALAAFESDAMSKVDKATRAIALEVFRRIILKTPVKTGRARNGWVCTIGAPAVAMAKGEDWFQGQEVGNYDKSGRAAIEEAANQIMGWDSERVAVYLTNNLPYIQRLENGWSGQAPRGMVALTLAEVDGIVARVA